MSGEKSLPQLLKTLKPELRAGDFVFCSITAEQLRVVNDAICVFTEPEGVTVIVTKETADQLQFSYSFVASWIMLTVHSSLEAVGLTAAFSTALAKHGISCNVVAAFYHDHIFVNKKDAEAAMRILNALSASGEMGR